MPSPSPNISAPTPASRRLASHSDAKLIALCVGGAADAWDALIDRYQALVYSTLLKQGLTHADADDVFQDVSLILFRHLGDLRDAARLAPWLISTARREAWRLKRRKGMALASEFADREWELESAEPIAQSASPRPDTEVMALQERQLVREGMQKLGDRCRELLTLLYMTDPPGTYADVTDRLGMPQGSIGPTRARCLQHLQKILHEAGF
jgi:RNA polymerase sigma factor (sigma-70 family)